MSKSIKKYKKMFAGYGYILWIFFICNSLAYAGDIVRPNTFSPGEVVSANKMNENVTALANGVNNNSPKIKANGEIVDGLLIGADYANGFYILTDKNFIFSLNVSGKMREVYIVFSSPDCTGQMYMGVDYYDEGKTIINIFRRSGTEEIYFTYPTDETVLLDFYQGSPGNCTPAGSPGGSNYYTKIYPNDPNITGFQSSYTGPITLER